MPTHNPPDSAEQLHQYTRYRLTQILLENGLGAIPFNVLNPVIIGALVLLISPVPGITLWVLLQVSVALYRYSHTKRTLEGLEPESDLSAIEKQFNLGAALSALIWSLGFVYFRQDLSYEMEIVFELALGGMAAGAFTSMATSQASYQVYLLFLFGPVIPATLLFRWHPEFSLVLDVFMLAFVTMLVITHNTSFRRFRAGVESEVEKEQLLRELSRKNQDLRIAEAKLKQISNLDELTGISNRRGFNHFIEAQMQRSKRSGKPVSMLMLDIDFFKEFNDAHGHFVGDMCLIHVAEILKRNVKRGQDFVCRYGGEEFLFVLPDTDPEGALLLAESIRKKIETEPFELENVEKLAPVTVSIGVATQVIDKEISYLDLIDQADTALYIAKRTGRNRTVVHSKPVRA